MNKQDVQRLNVVPEGKSPWLSYENYAKLGQLFNGASQPDSDYLPLYDFLVNTAGLKLAANWEQVHFNAFVLLRRGYKIEDITETEYSDLLGLMYGLEVPGKDDMDLHETGGHRDLYNYLTRQMGLTVEAGRGPVWYRALALVENYQKSLQPA